MASSDQTPTLSLPQFSSDDKPSWLGDWNSAMLAIDTAIGTIQGDLANTTTTATAAKTAAAANTAALQSLQGTVTSQGQAIQTAQGDIANIQEQLNDGLQKGTVKLGSALPFYVNSALNNTSIRLTQANGYLTVLGRPSTGYPYLSLHLNAPTNAFNSANQLWSNEGSYKTYIVGAFEGNPLNLPSTDITATTIGSALSLMGFNENGNLICFLYDSSYNLTFLIFSTTSDATAITRQTISGIPTSIAAVVTNIGNAKQSVTQQGNVPIINLTDLI